MDENAARAAFEEALRSHKPGFGSFFLARLFGLDILYTDETCRIEIDVNDFRFNPRGFLRGGVILSPRLDGPPDLPPRRA